MALVAYGSSDESETEEDEEKPPASVLMTQSDKPQVAEHCNGVDSEEEEEEAAHSPSQTQEPTRTFSLPPPKVSQTASLLIEDKPKQAEADKVESVPDEDVWEDDPYLEGDFGVSSGGILSDLPAPLVVASQLKAELPSANAEDEVEDLNDLKRKFAPKDEIIDKKEEPATKKACKERKPVRITVPALSEFDEEEKDRAKKKITPSNHRSGLFELLPPPKHETKKVTNRVLIPHTLTKPKAPPKPKAVPKPKVIPKKTHDADSDDEDDDSSLDFFSLSKSEEILEGPVDLPEDTPRTVGPTIPSHLRKKKTSLPPVEEAATSEISSCPSHQGSVEEQPSTSDDLQLSEDVLLRLQGATTRRTGKEEINIVEYRADDALAEAQIWKQKQLSEEQERHRSHSRRKKDGPSNVSRKKHQITYLAHQAKEREIEYKNMWAQNQAARQFHRSKYGF